MPETRWLTASEQHTWRSFLELHAEIESRLNQDLQRNAGLSLADYDVLVHLTDVPNARRRPAELAESLHWEKSRLSKQLARMEGRNLVAREECEEDRRGFYVALTEQGRQAIQTAAPPHVELVRRLVFDKLSDAECATLGSTLSNLLTEARQMRP